MVTPERTDALEALRSTLAAIAPGTPLRDGLERILRGRTGALIVMGQDRIVDSISTGGFSIDVPFTPTALRELAKMDGAIVIDADATRIHTANVHLMPDHSILSEETGTRHRTADRVAKQTGFPVISVSQSMQIRRRTRGQRCDTAPLQPLVAPPQGIPVLRILLRLYDRPGAPATTLLSSI